MIQSKYKVIDGTEYTVTQFPARVGTRLKFKLAKKLLPGLSTTKLNLDSDVNIQVILSWIGGALDNMDPDEAVNLIMEMLASTRRGTHSGQGGVEITPEIFDLEYAGKYLELYKVLAYVLEVNYGDFFGGVRSIIQNKLATVSPTPTPASAT